LTPLVKKGAYGAKSLTNMQVIS